MSSESSPGKKDPATQPVVPANTSRAGLALASANVAAAPVQTYMYHSGGRVAV